MHAYLALFSRRSDWGHGSGMVPGKGWCSYACAEKPGISLGAQEESQAGKELEET